MKLHNITLTGVLVVLTLSNSLLALQSMDFGGGSPDGGESISKEYQSLDVPKTIPDLGTIISTLTITDTFTIKDVNVKIDISHIWVSDLDVYLIAPDGTRIELFTDVGYDGDDFINTILDDEAPLSISEGFPPFTGSYRPEGNLSILHGSDINGRWRLEVTDDEWLISGVLNSWSLIVDVKPPFPLFEDTFPSTTIDTNKWSTVDGAVVDDSAGNEPSPPYALHFKRTNSVISSDIDLSGYDSAYLCYKYKSVDTESRDDFFVDYWDGNNWQNLPPILPGGEDSYWNQESYALPPDALHSQFRFYLQTMCSSYYDHWYIDDVEVIPFRLLGSTSFEGRNPFSLVELKTNPVVEQLIGRSSFYSGMDCNPQGVLYGASSSLYIIDPIDGSYTTVGTIDSLTERSILMRSISFAPDGTLYGVSSWDQILYTIDPVTAFATKVCDIVGGSIFGIEFCEDGTLYGAFADLYIIDPNTCQAIKVMDLPYGVYVTELDFAPDDFIYAVDDYKLYRINPLDGSVKLIGEYDSDLSTVASEVLTRNVVVLMGDVAAQPGRYSMAGITINNATKETGQDTELNILEEQALEADRQHAIQSMR